MGDIYVGTSGWMHPRWRGNFYPAHMGEKEWLDHYTQSFPCVEIGKSFYGLPERAQLLAWLDDTPDTFRFSLLAPRIITHYKKLKNCEIHMDTLLTRLDGLPARLGPIVFQLPARWRCNLRRLQSFLRLLPEQRRFVFDFRDPSWHCEEAYDLLRTHRTGLCVSDHTGKTSPLETTSDLVYVRLLGPAGGNTGHYHPQTLRGWGIKARGWKRKGKDVFLLFQSEAPEHAAKNAQRVKRYCESG